MLLILLLLFTIIPVAELFILIQVGKAIGAWDTVAIVLVTGIFGAYAAQTQGRAILRRLEAQLQRGDFPADSLVHGLLILTGGILLVTPGLMTDAVGLCMIFPPTRPFFVRGLEKCFRHGIRLGKIRVQTHYVDPFGRNVGPNAQEKPRPLKDADIIDMDSFKNQQSRGSHGSDGSDLGHSD